MIQDKLSTYLVEKMLDYFEEYITPEGDSSKRTLTLKSPF